MLHATPDSSSQEHLSYFVFNQIALVFFSAAGGLPRSVSFQVFEGFALAVSNLEMHALFVLGDLRARLVKLFHSRFVYVTEQNAEGIYIPLRTPDRNIVYIYSLLQLLPVLNTLRFFTRVMV